MNKETRLKIVLDILQEESERQEQKRKRLILSYATSCILGGLGLFALIVLFRP